MPNFAGKTVLVTGGASGIGAATCRRFAEQGARVAILDIDEPGATRLAHELTNQDDSCLAIGADISDEDQVQAAVKHVVDHFSSIDVLVNNAAVFVLKGIEATVEDWRKITDVNIIGTALVSKHVVPVMRARESGAIVNLGSISSFIAQPQFMTYNATKAAIAAITRCMALDLADDGIRVNAVCPGTVWTPIVEELCREDGLNRSEADAHPDWGGAHMLKRIAHAHEIADAVLFLASPQASFITAECLMVDGGYTAR
ncbi:MAG: glucose 1-dehydrogenase [Planctomycetaceae bacterium]